MNKFALIAITMFLVASPAIAFIDHSSQPDEGAIHGLSDDQFETYQQLNGIYKQLENDPQFQSLTKELNKAEMDMAKCPMSGPEAKACTDKYKSIYKGLAERLLELKEK